VGIFGRGGSAVSTGGGSPAFVNVDVVGNVAPENGGAMAFSSGAPVFVNVRFRGNASVYGPGGALLLRNTTGARLANVLFSGNYIDGGSGTRCRGAGLALIQSSPEIVQTTFAGNRVVSLDSPIDSFDCTSTGAALHNSDGSRPVLRNVVIWGNEAEVGPSIYDADAQSFADVDTSLVEGGYANPNAPTPDLLYTADPRFAAPVAPANAPFVGGDYRVTDGSPTLDRGATRYLPPDTFDLDDDGDTTEPLPLDLDGTPRVVDNDLGDGLPARVDLGAFEAPIEVQLPVELTALTATADGADGVVLAWRTASETNNAGFAVEHAAPRAEGMPADGTPEDAGGFTEVGFVEGAGTTTEAQTYRFRLAGLRAGTHRLRLRQVDFDGTPTVSPVVEVTLGLEAPYRLAPPAPNPFATRAEMALTVRTTQAVTVAAYDVLGRRVAVLHDGPLRAGQRTPLTLDGTRLASGVYLVRVTGETFATTARVVRVR
jgi:hypothetical protein